MLTDTQLRNLSDEELSHRLGMRKDFLMNTNPANILHASTMAEHSQYLGEFYRREGNTTERLAEGTTEVKVR